MSQSETKALNFNYIQIGAIGVAILGILLAVVGATQDSDRLFQTYLFAYLFWMQLSVGCLLVLLIASLFPARWTFPVKRILSAGARTLPLVAILSLPLLINLGEVFPWAAEGAELSDGKEVYLNEGFFVIRTVIYFTIWIPLAFVLTELSYQNDRDYSEERTKQIQMLGIGGLIVMFVTATFAAIDWSLSLDYNSFSSIYGWLAMSQEGLAAFAFAILILAIFWKNGPLATVSTPNAVADLGALLLVSFMIWAYLSFTQYIVMWSGNLPDKFNLYFIRTSGDWEGYAAMFALFNVFAFIMLAIPGMKRTRWVLASVAGFLLFMRVVELFWIVMPPFSADLTIQAWDIALLFGFGGFWVALFFWFLGRAPLVPQNDPGLQKLSQDKLAYKLNGTIFRQPAK